MGSTNHLFVMLLAVLCSIALSSDAEKSTIELSVDLSVPVASLPDRYLSVAIDSAQVVGGNFWPNQPGKAFNFSRPKLLNLAKAISPAILRIGGTTGDKIYYDMSNQPQDPPPSPYKYTLNRTQFDALNRFALEANFQVAFGLNCGPGPRDINNVKVWNASNALSLLNYVQSEPSASAIWGWELSNEPNLFFLAFGPKYQLNPTELAEAFHTLMMVARPLNASWKYIGPDVSFEYPVLGQVIPDYMQNFLRELAEMGSKLDVATYHFYPLLSERCLGPLPDPWIATPAKYLEPRVLNKVLRYAPKVAKAVNAYQPQAEIWTGETSGSLCGGQPGVANRFVDSLWWMDQLGLLAQSQQTTGQVRQTLSGSTYGLIEDDTLTPRPDYWATLGFKSLMGNDVYNVTVAGTETLRAYAHNGFEDATALVLLLINLNTSSISAGLPSSLRDLPCEQYIYTSAELAGFQVFLNGKELHVDASGNVPALQGTAVGASSTISLPPTSYGFFVFNNVL